MATIDKIQHVAIIESMMTYQLVQRDPNSFTFNEETGRVVEHEIVATCGHKHKSIDTAILCSRKHDDTFLGRYGIIEIVGTGKPAETAMRDEYEAAQSRLHRAGK